MGIHAARSGKLILKTASGQIYDLPYQSISVQQRPEAYWTLPNSNPYGAGVSAMPYHAPDIMIGVQANSIEEWLYPQTYQRVWASTGANDDFRGGSLPALEADLTLLPERPMEEADFDQLCRLALLNNCPFNIKLLSDSPQEKVISLLNLSGLSSISAELHWRPLDCGLDVRYSDASTFWGLITWLKGIIGPFEIQRGGRPFLP